MGGSFTFVVGWHRDGWKVQNVLIHQAGTWCWLELHVRLPVVVWVSSLRMVPAFYDGAFQTEVKTAVLLRHSSQITVSCPAHAIGQRTQVPAQIYSGINASSQWKNSKECADISLLSTHKWFTFLSHESLTLSQVLHSAQSFIPLWHQVQA